MKGRTSNNGIYLNSMRWKFRGQSGRRMVRIALAFLTVVVLLVWLRIVYNYSAVFFGNENVRITSPFLTKSGVLSRIVNQKKNLNQKEKSKKYFIKTGNLVSPKIKSTSKTITKVKTTKATTTTTTTPPTTTATKTTKIPTTTTTKPTTTTTSPTTITTTTKPTTATTKTATFPKYLPQTTAATTTKLATEKQPTSSSATSPPTTLPWKSKLGLLSPIEDIPELDISEYERLKKLKEIRDWIFQTMNRIQSEGDCDSKKLMVCNFDSVTGFGHAIHRTAICAHAALALNRVLIIDHWQWRPFDNLHNFTVNELGSCAHLVEKSRTIADRCNFNNRSCYIDDLCHDIDQKYPVLELSTTIEFPVPKYMPGTLPRNVLRRLKQLKVRAPYHWFTSQLIGYFLMQLNPQFQQIVDEQAQKLALKSPCVGIHIRQTDKVKSTEAAFINETRYVALVEKIFNENFPGVKRRTIFLAADNNEVQETLQKYSNNTWDIKMYEATQRINEATRQRIGRLDYSHDTLETMMVDLFLMLQCDHQVVTYSSNIGRLVYEMRTALTPYVEADRTVHSLQGNLVYVWMAFAVQMNGEQPIYWIATRDTPEFWLGDMHFISVPRKTLLQGALRKQLVLQNGTRLDVLHGSVHQPGQPMLAGIFRLDDLVPWPDKPKYAHDMAELTI